MLSKLENEWQKLPNLAKDCHDTGRAVRARAVRTRAVAQDRKLTTPGRGWVVWAVGVLTYVLTVMQRTSLGVAGLEAARRFGITPGVLAGFVFIQVTVYVAAQTPAGLLVDRFGPRVMLVVSGVFLTAGQLVLATATALPQAVLARVLVGLGDAIVFVAVLGLVPRWFAPRRVPDHPADDHLGAARSDPVGRTVPDAAAPRGLVHGVRPGRRGQRAGGSAGGRGRP